jgi:hypothetical protein
MLDAKDTPGGEAEESERPSKNEFGSLHKLIWIIAK